MRLILVFATLLCLTKWMVDASYRPAASCCPQWSNTEIPLSLIVDYTIQSEGICAIKAVKLHTRRGKTLCSDPDRQWVRGAMVKVDMERRMKASQEKVQNEKGTTSNTATPAYTTSKKAPRKGRRKGWRHRKKSRGRKKLRGRIN
ncbi:C-C motif chemokine 4-like [Antennarius striatus]|uniref:C-C motif chemokine 4-like n=1 Tax=Antennarius striatus TaxID=241820 RepID=UPI0035B33274